MHPEVVEAAGHPQPAGVSRAPSKKDCSGIFLAWIGLNVADAILTGISLHLGAGEVNPFLGTIALSLSLQRMLLIKILLSIALGGLLWQRQAHRIFRLLNGALVVVVMYNALIISYAMG